MGILALGGIFITVACGLYGMWASTQVESISNEPVPMTAPTETAMALLLHGAATLTPIPPVDRQEEVPNTKLGGGGESCLYSSTELNDKLPPVRDGDWTKYYECVNGYWRVLGKDKINNQTGEWGSDGVEEVIFIKYNKKGKIVHRIWTDSENNIIPGPGGD